MSIETYIIYLGTVLLFFAHPPGPSQLLFIGGAVQHGLKKATPIMAGDLTANAIQIMIAGFGLASIIALSANAFSVIKWAGVAYLIWMGVRMIRDATRPADAKPVPSGQALFRRGFMTSAANPYAVVFFAALFPQFIDPAAPVAAQVAILGLTYLIIDGAILLAMGTFASRLVTALGHKFERWLSILSGLGLIAAAIAIATRGETEPAK
ncbi:threonine/homoserine/homoserine lactone efflux protein [Yoonia maricola]|uniref:Threonine/homoserine/homoserine lactone efflux protein n=1 Tax=Yoonia maricola TaxID=420999 RepID=A0A2M8W2L1_9RHOB|nr:LysE family transporter [Yoonia maricola]PJI85140.1 threonine/homoserine/homoserine lactone efflux protein [Yoonia maricola]